MYLGATFPSLEIGRDLEPIGRFARGAEILGYHHILALEHVLGFAQPNQSSVGALDSSSPFHEPLVLFGYLAAVTERIELATGVLVLPQRQAVLVAKQAAEVDFLSRGRLRLGVGVGWVPEEFAALGMDYQTRGRRCAEQIALMKQLWTSQIVTFHGEWHHVENAGISPLPVRRPIPIWIGGHVDATFQRVAQLGDGWLTTRPPDDQARAMVERLRQQMHSAGRSMDEIGIEAPLSINDIPETEWVGYAERWRELGGTHLFVNTMGMGFTTVDEHIDALSRVKGILEAAGLT